VAVVDAADWWHQLEADTTQRQPPPSASISRSYIRMR